MKTENKSFFIDRPRESTFKDFIKAPYKKRKWNFWCRERKYKPEFFEEKFQK